MRPSRFSEEQIIGILKEQEAGMKTADVCRRRGISPTSFYKWKAKCGGLEVSEGEPLWRHWFEPNGERGFGRLRTRMAS